MDLLNLQLSLAALRENIRYLREDAIEISFPIYLKMRAAEKAAVSAIARIIYSNGILSLYGQSMPKKTKENTLHRLPDGKTGSRRSKARSRSRLRVVCSGR
jgi:hypothetical protein